MFWLLFGSTTPPRVMNLSLSSQGTPQRLSRDMLVQRSPSRDHFHEASSSFACFDVMRLDEENFILMRGTTGGWRFPISPDPSCTSRLREVVCSRVPIGCKVFNLRELLEVNVNIVNVITFRVLEEYFRNIGRVEYASILDRKLAVEDAWYIRTYGYI